MRAPTTSLEPSASAERTVAPSRPCVAAPFSMISFAMRSARFDGTAKPTPMLPAVACAAPPAERIATLTPMSLPSESTSAPPELPGLIAASVWMTGSETLPAPLLGACCCDCRRRGWAGRRRSRTGSAGAVALVALAGVALGVVGRGRCRRRRDVDAAVERAHDAVGDGAGEPERCADGDRRVADVELVGVGELERGEARCVDQLDHGEVARAGRCRRARPCRGARRWSSPGSSGRRWRRRASRRGCS